MSNKRDDRFLTPAERLTKEAAQAREDIDLFNEEMRVVLGQDASSDGDQPLHTHNGKVIKRQGRKHTKDDGLLLKNASMTDAFLEGLNYLPQAVQVTREIFKAGASMLTKTFGPKADIVLPERHEDNECIYDMMQVSEPVYHKLIQEAQIIAAKVKELEAIHDPALRDALERQIEDMAADYEMRVHPITMKYVHDVERVLREEKLHTERSENHNFSLGVKSHLICIFQLKQGVDGTKKVKRDVGDQFDNKPEEVIASGEHLPKGPNVSANAPSLTLH